MLDRLDIAQRARSGPRMTEPDWDMALFRKMNDLADRFEVVVPEEDSWESFHNDDEALAGRALEAAIAFLAETGIWCVQTERVIRVTEAEVRQSVAEAPRGVVVGEGEDARRFGEGRLDVAPGVGTGALHAPFEDEIAVDVARSFVQALGPTLGYLQSYNYRRLDGREIYGVPMEAAAGTHAVVQMRRAFREAGRPGLAVFYYPLSTADAVLTAPIDPARALRPTDGVLLSTLPDIKLDLGMLTAGIIYRDYGATALNGGGGAAVGGFCGGIAGGVIESIVKPIVGWMAYGDVLGGGGIRDLHMSRRPYFRVQPLMSWGSSLSAQALGRVTPLWGGDGLNTGGGVGHCSGPGTRSHLLEIAMASIGSGVAGGRGSAPDWHVATMNARRTPYEILFGEEVAEATRRAGLRRTDLPNLMQRLAAQLEGQPTEPGRDIRELWDLRANEPLPEYRALGAAVQRWLGDHLGLSF